MKKITFACLITFSMISCNKETCTDNIQNQDEVQTDCGGSCEPCGITYSPTGAGYDNILFGEDTLNLNQAEYGFKAEVPMGSQLTIKLSQVSGGVWYYGLGTEGAWTISTFSAGEQVFEAEGGSSLNEMPLDFSSMTGTFVVWYYENGTETVDRTKVVIVS